jgi:hypothetical protein
MMKVGPGRPLCSGNRRGSLPPEFPLGLGDGQVVDAGKPTGGEPILYVFERIWLLTIIDAASRAVLGYPVSLDRKYTGEAVLMFDGFHGSEG